MVKFFLMICESAWSLNCKQPLNFVSVKRIPITSSKKERTYFWEQNADNMGYEGQAEKKLFFRLWAKKGVKWTL